MKVFSKTHKNNKSTPLLPLPLAATLKPTPKPKGISKVTSYKNKLAQTNHHPGNIALSTQLTPGYQQRPFTERTNASCWIKSKEEAVMNHSYRMSPVPMVSSVDYASCRSHKERYSDEPEPVDSVLCYSKMIKNKNPAMTDKENKSRMLNLTTI